MKPTVKVTDKDYRQAKFMINNASRVFPQPVVAARIIATAQRVIALYKQQNGKYTTNDIVNAKNLLGQHLQNANLFFAVRNKARAM